MVLRRSPSFGDFFWQPNLFYINFSIAFNFEKLTLCLGHIAYTMKTIFNKLPQICLGFLGISTFGTNAVQGQSITDNISTFLKSEMIKRNIPGLQIAIIRNGQLELLKSFGVANIEHRVIVNDSTLFSINSATKAFTAVAIMQLAEKKQLELEMPVSHYLEHLPEQWKSVTLTQLLTHTSGLPDFIDTKKGGFVAGLSYEDAWEAIKNYPMEFLPGTQSRYNQTNYVLLGQLIEKLNGKPFEQVVQEQQFNPSGMKKSCFGDSRDVIIDKAPTYMLSRKSERAFVEGKTMERTWEEFPELRATSGINSTAKELANWILALQNGSLLQPQSLQTMWKAAKLTNGTYSGWTPGWAAARIATPRAVAGIGGSRSWFYIYPDQHLAVIILTNLKTTEPEDLAMEVAGFYYPELKAINGGNLPESIMPLRRLLEQQGYSKAIPLSKEIQKSDKNFHPSEKDLSNWAYYLLLKENNKKHAIEIFKLYVNFYPTSTEANDNLAEGYEAIGDTQNAIIFYNKAVKIDQQNKHAAERLKILSQK